MHINIDLLPHWCLGEWVSEMKKEGQLRRSRVETERTGSSGTLLYSLTASFSSAAFYLFLFWFDYSFSRTGAQAGAHSVIPFSSATGNYMKINWFSMLTSIVNCLSCFNCSSFICRSPGEHFSFTSHQPHLTNCDWAHMMQPLCAASPSVHPLAVAVAAFWGRSWSWSWSWGSMLISTILTSEECATIEWEGAW